MHYYPLFLDLRECDILLVGAGEVGARKLGDIMDCSPKNVLIIDPSPPEDRVMQFLSYPNVDYQQRVVGEQDFVGKKLVFAATGFGEVNNLVAVMCKNLDIWCNIADAPEKSDFVVPAHFRRGDICLCISTGGTSPALAKKMRKELEAWLDEKYVMLAVVLKRLRPLILSLNMRTSDNSKIFRELVNSELGNFLANKDFMQAREILKTILPQTLQPYIGDLLHEL